VLPLLLVASLALSVLFALRLPLDTNPDETAHRDYVRLIVEERGFVRFQEQDFGALRPGEAQRYETHQPPLYYLLLVPVYALTGGNVFALRLVAAVLQLLTILVAFRAGRDLFPARPEIALGVAAFVAFLPTQAQLSGAINNDALTTLICVALFWRMGLLAVGGQSVREAVVVGALLGVGLLTKSTVLTLFPSLLVAYAIAVRARLMKVGQAATCLAVALGLGFLSPHPG
jgi:4-amino-4-deoxy-L-arabinose transferase-like glycosyltransferase